MSQRLPTNVESIEELHSLLHNFEIECYNCHKKMIGPRSKRYCSKECAKEYKYKQKLPDLTRNCKQCGIEFIASNKSQEYCSLDCKHTIPCEICGKLFVAKAGTTCSFECSEVKRKRTCLERFDAENALQNPAIKARQVETTFKNHGINHVIHREEVVKKARASLQKNMKNPEWVAKRTEKTRKTNNERYNCDNPMQNPEVRAKALQSNLEKYGDTNPMNNPEVKAKALKTNREKYGHDNPMQNPEVKAKGVETLMKNHGVAYPMQSPEIRKTWESSMMKTYGVPKAKYIHITNFEHYEDKEFILKNFVKGDYFLRDEMAKYFNISESVVNGIKNKLGIKIPNIESYVSTEQRYIFDQINIDEKMLNDRQLINPLEIDILFYKHKLGVEYNGLFWHSRNIADMTEEKAQAHINKTTICENIGYELLHIFETENLELWVSLIKSKLGLNEVVKNFDVKDVDLSVASEFVKENSITPNFEFLSAVGAYRNNELVSIICYTKYDEYIDIILNCDKCNFNVPNFLKQAVEYLKNKYALKIRHSFDRRFGSHQHFIDCEFSVIEIKPPRKLYVTENYAGISENEITDRIIYDCGLVVLSSDI